MTYLFIYPLAAGSQKMRLSHKMLKTFSKPSFLSIYPVIAFLNSFFRGNNKKKTQLKWVDVHDLRIIESTIGLHSDFLDSIVNEFHCCCHHDLSHQSGLS